MVCNRRSSNCGGITINSKKRIVRQTLNSVNKGYPTKDIAIMQKISSDRNYCHTTAYVRTLLRTIDWYRDNSVQYYWGTFRRLAAGHKVFGNKVRGNCHKYYLGDRNERCSSRGKAVVLITAFTFAFFINGKL